MRLIRVKAFPDSKRDAIEEVRPDQLRVFVREPAQNNLANRAVILAVAVHYTLNPKQLRLITGHRSLNKTIEVRGT